MTDLTGYIIKRTPEVVTILMKIERSDENQILGTGEREVRSGQDWEGWTFEELQNYEIELMGPLVPREE